MLVTENTYTPHLGSTLGSDLKHLALTGNHPKWRINDNQTVLPGLISELNFTVATDSAAAAPAAATMLLVPGLDQQS